MKKIHVLLFAFFACVCLSTTISCSDDDLGPTIFPSEYKPLDRSLGTFPLDSFITKYMLEPYNMKFIYRMEDVGADMQKNLVPASYEKSVQLAILMKYLWLDVYAKLAGEKEVFLKKYAPRIIHVIGSPSYNDDGSRTVGIAEGGVKISMLETNKLDVNQIDGEYGLNNLFFHTMHHEFAHILDQTYQRPTTFDQISSGLYDAVGWADKHDSVQAALGFVTPYGSSQTREDWVEVMSCFITYDEDRWNRIINSAKTDWEDIDFTLDSFNVRYPGAWAEQQRVESGQQEHYTRYDRDTVGYLHQLSNYDYKLARKVVKRDADGFVVTDSLGNWTFDQEHWDNIEGDKVILEKLDLVREWLNRWDINLDTLRKEVQTRQYMTDSNGKFLRDEYGNYINKLTQPYEKDPSKTLIEYLNEEIESFKKLMTK